MPIYPGGKVKSDGESVQTLMDNMPDRQVFVKDTDGEIVGTGMRLLPDGTLLAPDGFSVESGSIDFGDVITMSESSGFVGIRNNLYNAMYQLVDYGVPRTGPSLAPSIFQLNEAENMANPQSDDSVTLTANPLLFNYTTTLNARTNSITFRCASAMTNVRIKITKTDVGVALKYLPSKSVWSTGVGGMNFVAGDNIIDFKDSPVPLSAGVQLTFEIRATAVSLKGNSSGIPYFGTMVQRGQFVTIPLSSEVTAGAVRDKLAGLTSPNKLPKTAIQDGVLTVNGQFGDVLIPGQVNSDWNSSTGLSQILNKPILFSGSYPDLTNKPTSFPPSGHTHTIADVVGLESTLDGKINTGASIPYATLTGTPTIPTNTNQLTNGSGYITSAQAPVQSVNGQTGAVSISIPAAQIQSDWNQANTSSLDYIKNKPAIPVVSYPVTSVNTKTGAVVLTNTDVGAAATIHTHIISDVTGLQTALNAKFTTPAGTTSQYVRGDGSLATFPAIPTVPTVVSAFTNDAGYLTSVTSAQLTTALGYTPYNGTTNPNGYVTQAGSRSAISLTTTGTSGAATYNSTTGVLNVPNYSVPARTFTNPTRTLNTGFQISTTQDAQVTYAVDITVSALLIGGSSGRVYLEYANEVGFTTGVTVVTSSGNSTGGVLSITNVGTANLTGVIPAGKYVRLRTVNVTATPTFTFQSAQEVLL